MTWLTFAECQGYDYASACARNYRSNRARNHATAPCDLSKHNYCTTPGNSYPWHAIRRFVKENQGLMRRMYGEERHISVLKAELENFIEDDVDDDDIRKSSNFAEDILKTKMMYSKESHGRAMKTKPHFRPIQTTPTSVEKNKKVDNETLRVKPLQTNKNNVKLNNTKESNSTEITSNETVEDDKAISYKTKLESIANIEINNLDPDVITLEAVIKQSIETNSIYPNYSASPKSDYLSPISKNSTTTTSTIGNNLTTTTEAMNRNSTEIPATNSADADNIPTTETLKDGWKPMNSDASTLPPTLLFSEHDKDNKLEKANSNNNNNNEKKEEIHTKPHFQESMRPSVIKLRGA